MTPRRRRAGLSGGPLVVCLGASTFVVGAWAWASTGQDPIGWLYLWTTATVTGRLYGSPRPSLGLGRPGADEGPSNPISTGDRLTARLRCPRLGIRSGLDALCRRQTSTARPPGGPHVAPSSHGMVTAAPSPSLTLTASTGGARRPSTSTSTISRSPILTRSTRSTSSRSAALITPLGIGCSEGRRRG